MCSGGLIAKSDILQTTDNKGSIKKEGRTVQKVLHYYYNCKVKYIFLQTFL